MCSSSCSRRGKEDHHLILYCMIPAGVGQLLAFLTISEKSTEVLNLKVFYAKECLSTSVSSSVLQNFLKHKDKGKSMHLISCQRNEVNPQLELLLSFLLYILFNNVSKVYFGREYCLVARTSFGHFFLSRIHNR